MRYSKEQLKVGSIIYVKGWWVDYKLVRCQVVNMYDTWVGVQPLEGNPHRRMLMWKRQERWDPNWELGGGDANTTPR
jgi:hypothetical protein